MEFPWFPLGNKILTPPSPFFFFFSPPPSSRFIEKPWGAGFFPLPFSPPKPRSERYNGFSGYFFHPFLFFFSLKKKERVTVGPWWDPPTSFPFSSKGIGGTFPFLPFFFSFFFAKRSRRHPGYLVSSFFLFCTIRPYLGPFVNAVVFLFPSLFFPLPVGYSA